MNIKNLQLAILATIALTFTACGNKTEKETSFDEPTTEMETSSFDTEEITDGPTDEISEEKEEWMGYFEEKRKEANKIQDLIDKTDK